MRARPVSGWEAVGRPPSFPARAAGREQGDGALPAVLSAIRWMAGKEQAERQRGGAEIGLFLRELNAWSFSPRVFGVLAGGTDAPGKNPGL